MKQNDQAPMAFNAGLATICVILFAIFAGFLIWNRKTEAQESKRLQELAAGTKTENEQPDVSKEPVEEDLDEAQATPQPETTPEPAPEPVTAQEIAFWGDEFFSTEEDLANSYQVKLGQLLAEQNYPVSLTNKTLHGAGTLSTLKMAGIPQEELEGYAAAHQQAANGQELAAAELEIRELSEEQLARTETDAIPVLTMGYYGGWNKDPMELIGQQQRVLDTFGKNRDHYIIIGVRPQDRSVDIPAYEQAMKATWGDHYISTIDICTKNVPTYEGQAEVATALFEKLTTLGYITQEG